MDTPTPAGRYTTPSASRFLDSLRTGSVNGTAQKRPAQGSPEDLSVSHLRRSQLSSAFSASMSTRAFERQIADADERRRAAENALEEVRAKCERLERDRAWAEAREAEQRAHSEEEARVREKEREDAAAEVRKFRKESVGLKAEVEDLREEVARARGSRERDVEGWSRRYDALERASRGLREEVDASGKKEMERRREIAGLRERVEELEEELASVREGGASGLPTPERNRAGAEDLTLIRGELHRQSTNLRALEAANARLSHEVGLWRERAQGVEVLREEKRDAEKRGLEVEGLRGEVARLKGELDAARKEKEEWHAFLTSPSAEPTSSTPTVLTSHLAQLRLNHATLLSKHADQTVKLELVEEALEKAEKRALEGERRAKEAEVRRREAEERAGRERRLGAIRDREVEGLKAILTNYASNDGSEDTTDVLADLKDERTRQLEEMIVELKGVNAELTAALEERDDRVVQPQPSATRDDEETRRELKEERERRQRIEQELERVHAALEATSSTKETLQQKLFELGESIGTGAHIPPGERVLQLGHNPVSDHFAVRAQQLDELREERDALLAARGVPGGGDGWVPTASWEQVQREKEELIVEARGREKRMLRLKQVFAAKASEFREAVTSILGYKLNFSGNGRVRLTSVYDPSTALVFQSSDDGNDIGSMRLIGVGEREAEKGREHELGEAEGIHGGLQFWVRDRKSIPCFLASLTLECFEKTTVGRQAGYA